MRILLVGEGNLTFAYALVKKLSKSKCFGRYHAHAPAEADVVGRSRDTDGPGTASNKPVVTVIVTTFDSKDELIAKYPETVPIFHYFTEKTRICILYKDCVDASRIAESLGPAHDNSRDSFDMIFFNNPHTGKEDLFLQHCLLAHFFASAREVLRRTTDGETAPQVVVSLCDEQPVRWGLLQAAARSGFACVAAVPFTNAEFPEFDNKRHQNDAKFPFQQMTHFYFVQVGGRERGATSNVAAQCALTDLVGVVGKAAHHRAASSAPSPDLWQVLAGHFCTSTASHHGAQSRAESSRVPPPPPPRCNDSKQISLSKEDAAQLHRDCARWGDIASSTSSLSKLTLHPLLCYHTSLRANGSGPDSTDGQPIHPQENYSPLLRVRELAALLKLQEKLISAETTRSAASSPKQQPQSVSGQINAPLTEALPPHLDAALLGRPLTSKEQAKLHRYEAKLRSTLALSKKRSLVNSATATTYKLPFETDPLAFVGTLEKDAPASSTYCAFCGTEFQTPERFAEHLSNLTPLEGNFSCPFCPERKPFKTERALRQHEARAH